MSETRSRTRGNPRRRKRDEASIANCVHSGTEREPPFRVPRFFPGVRLIAHTGTIGVSKCRGNSCRETLGRGTVPRASVRASGATRARRTLTMSLSSKRAANPVSSPPPHATKRPRGDNAKASAGGEDAAKPPEKASMLPAFILATICAGGTKIVETSLSGSTPLAASQ